MTFPAVQLPDVELLLTGWLRPQLTGRRVVTDLPTNLESQLPLVQVTRIGGGRVQQVLDRARVDLDFYALTREDARDLGAQVEALLPTLRGVTTGGGVVGLIEFEVGLSWRPDWNERVRRYGLTFSATVRAA